MLRCGRHSKIIVESNRAPHRLAIARSPEEWFEGGRL
jgi:hypothetical protein